MASQNELQEIINTLSPNEIKEFNNKWTTKGSHYAAVFKWMTAKKKPGNTRMKELLAERGCKQGLSQTKAQLKEKLLEFLVFRYITDAKSEHALLNRDTLILKLMYNRGVMNIDQKWHVKVRERALRLGYPNSLVQSYHLEASRLKGYSKKLFNLFKSVNDYSKLIIIRHELISANHLLRSYSETYADYLSNPSYFTELREMIDLEDNRYNELQQHVLLHYNLIHARWLCSLILLKSAKAQQLSRDIIELVDREPFMLKMFHSVPSLICIGLFTAVSTGNYLAYKETLQPTVTRLEQLGRKNSINDLVFEHSLPQLLLENEQQEVSSTLAKFQKLYSRRNISQNNGTNLAIAYHLAHLSENYNQAQMYLSDCLLVTKAKNQLEYENRTRISEFMLLADNGAAAVIPSKVKAYQKWLKRNMPYKDETFIEYPIIRHFPKLFDYDGRPIPEALQHFKEALLPFGNHPVLCHFFGGLMPWLEAKIQGRTYWDVVQERVQQQLASTV